MDKVMRKIDSSGVENCLPTSFCSSIPDKENVEASNQENMIVEVESNEASNSSSFSSKHLSDHGPLVTSKICSVSNNSMDKPLNHRCHTCHANFTSQYKLKRHSKEVHLKIEPIACDWCSYSTTRFNHLKVHVLRIHREKEKFLCNVSECVFESLTNYELEKHFRKMHVEFPCTKCEFKANDKTLLKKHMRQHDKSYIFCSECNFSSKVKSTLVLHFCESHPEVKLSRSDWVNESFQNKVLQPITNENDLKSLNQEDKQINSSGVKSSHSLTDSCSITAPSLSQQKKTGDKTIEYTCIICSVHLASECSLKKHIDGVHFRENRHCCKYCDYKSYRMDELNKHIKNIHTKETRYSCDAANCEFKSYNKYVVDEHFRKRHSLQYTCNECGLTVNERKKLKVHMLKHREKFKYSCSDCDYSSDWKSNITIHFARIHSKKTKRQCDKCDYKCFTNKDLNLHISTHHTKNMLSCPNCEYKCAQSKTLEGHVMYHHTTERPFACNDCDYTAPSKIYIDIHRKVKHKIITIGSTFNCSACEYVSYIAEDIKSHFSAKHSKKDDALRVDADPFSSDDDDTIEIKEENIEVNETIKDHILPSKNSDEEFLKVVKPNNEECDTLLLTNSYCQKHENLEDESQKSDKTRNNSFDDDTITEFNCDQTDEGKFACELCLFSCNDEEVFILHFKGHLSSE